MINSLSNLRPECKQCSHRTGAIEGQKAMRAKRRRAQQTKIVAALDNSRCWSLRSVFLVCRNPRQRLSRTVKITARPCVITSRLVADPRPTLQFVIVQRESAARASLGLAGTKRLTKSSAICATPCQPWSHLVAATTTGCARTRHPVSVRTGQSHPAANPRRVAQHRAVLLLVKWSSP